MSDAMHSVSEQDWYATGPGRSTCKGCGEERLVHQVADSRGTQNFCQVCSRAWWVDGPQTRAEYAARYLPRTADAQGRPMDGGE